MGEPTLREDLERQARRFGVDVAVAVSLLPEGRLDDPRAALTVTASELSDIIEPMILALLDRRIPTLSPGNQEDSLSRDHAPSITGGPLDRAATREAEPPTMEQAARAIAAEKRRKSHWPPDPYSPLIDRVWRSYLGQARAAFAVFERQGAQ